MINSYFLFLPEETHHRTSQTSVINEADEASASAGGNSVPTGLVWPSAEAEEKLREADDNCSLNRGPMSVEGVRRLHLVGTFSIDMYRCNYMSYFHEIFSYKCNIGYIPCVSLIVCLLPGSICCFTILGIGIFPTYSI